MDKPSVSVSIGVTSSLADFRDALQQLINYYSIDAIVNVPDYMLADYLMKDLMRLRDLQYNLSSWKGSDNEGHR